MQQLNIQDAGFVYQETANTPMHISGIAIFDQSSTSRKRMSKKQIIDYINARIHQAPILKQKLFEPPFELERPYWAEDPNFVPHDHIYQHFLPAPGNKKQLSELISQIVSCPLNMSKPLWEIHIIEGLNDYENVGKNSFAMITKIHHCCVDGGSGNNLYAALVDLTADAEPFPKNNTLHNADENTKTKLPGRYEMLATAYGNNTVDVIQQIAAITKRLPGLVKIASRLYTGRIDPGAKLSVPLTRFNKTPEKERVVDFADFDLQTIKEIKQRVPGCTINDIAVCIISGALRRFLQHHNELPQASLGAMLPKNIRSKNDMKKKNGNMVGGLFATIHTDIADPKERLLAISDCTKKAKRFATDADTASILPNMMGGFLYPKAGKALTQFMQKNKIMERVGPVIVNTVITNVVGPNFELFHAGAKQHIFFAFPPLTDGIGISHAVYSYQDKVSISVISCPSMIDDTDLYIQFCRDSFNELVAATL